MRRKNWGILARDFSVPLAGALFLYHAGLSLRRFEQWRAALMPRHSMASVYAVSYMMGRDGEVIALMYVYSHSQSF